MKTRPTKRWGKWAMLIWIGILSVHALVLLIGIMLLTLSWLYDYSSFHLG